MGCAHRRPRVPEGIASQDALDTPALLVRDVSLPRVWGCPARPLPQRCSGMLPGSGGPSILHGARGAKRRRRSSCRVFEGVPQIFFFPYPPRVGARGLNASRKALLVGFALLYPPYIWIPASAGMTEHCSASPWRDQ
jgi:hypothetical protein